MARKSNDSSSSSFSSLSSSRPLRLPVIDASLLGTDRESELVEIWDYSFTTYGFVRLIGHGIDEHYVAFERGAQTFFARSTEEKTRFGSGASYGHGGYTPRGGENVAKSSGSTSGNDKTSKRPADAVESIVSTDENFVYFGEGDFREHGRTLYRELSKLLRDIMRLSALTLNIDEHFFHEKGGYDEPSNAMRVAHYLETKNAASGELMADQEEERQLRYGEHTDYTGFTFLWRNASNGLQCKNPFHGKSVEEIDALTQGRTRDYEIDTDNEWIDIPVDNDLPHTLVVNAGDLLHRWTNDYFVSNTHRVVDVASQRREKEEGNKEPISVVFFTGPSNNTVCETLKSSKVSQQNKYTPVRAGDYLWAKLNRTDRKSVV